MSEYEFDRYVDNFLSSIDDGSRLIVSVADTMPPQASLMRIKKIGKAVKEFGPVGSINGINILA